LNWSGEAAIRTRREQLGLSQTDLAQRLGVSKSLLSHIEAGKRQPSEAQIAVLATTLRIPPELLLVGTGRMPTNVLSVLENDAPGIVAAIRQRTEAAAVAYPTAPTRIPVAAEVPAPLASERLPERIDVHKTSAAFRAHSYHTKVPPEAIRPLIRAFTRVGETVFDPFCGSGMTGVAALMEGRNALLSDLSPAAVHIARNYTTLCDPVRFAEALESVSRSVAPTIAWLYRPLGTDATVEYTTWSDVFACDNCNHRIVYWDAFREPASSESSTLRCPKCATQRRKTDLEWLGEEPVESHTSSGSTRIDSHRPTQAELALIEEGNSAPIPYWVPQQPFGRDREMWRAAHSAMGISDVSGFFTRRNLHALAALRHAIIDSAEGRIREALLFAFTAAVNRASRRYQWNAKRPTNVMTGTLYISSLRYEWNVWSLFRRKAADVLRYYKAFPDAGGAAEVFQRSATDLGCLPDRSVDMVFMDPPFGSNIFYADSSLLWESWLGEWTDERAEIVVNKHKAPSEGGKTLKDYGERMRLSFEHAARVLKTGGRAVLAFSNSDDRVWEVVQNSLADAGFETRGVHLLNKGQPSIKGVKGVTGREQVTTLDLLLCLEHRARSRQMVVPFPAPHSVVERTVQQVLTAGGGRTDEVYSAAIRSIVQAGYSVSGITMSSVTATCVKLGAVEEDGRWRLSTISEQPASADFISGYLTGPNTLPKPNESAPTAKPLGTLRVPGGRSSAFYLAHSYHTKVPPEAIRPFIEHYTRPGDIVLDPFCGSGMTGVAATLAGRRSILNDLSPAAIHLSWNHTRPCDPDKLASAFAEIDARVRDDFERLYGTTHDGQPAKIHWTLWSTRHQCLRCSAEFSLWDVMDRTTGRLGSTIKCPHCRRSLERADLPSLGSYPAWIAFETTDGKRFEKAPDGEDLKRATAGNREGISDWYPQIALQRNNEMYLRCALHLRGVSNLDDFYTPRNLEALAILWREIMAVKDDRIQRALAFAFTNTAWHGTRMRRFNARGGQRPLTGTLYIPQLSSEANVLEVMRNKIKQLRRYYRAYRPSAGDLPSLLLGSATSLALIPDGTIDYVFTDPPFGSNIYYADCNLIWESWLGRVTDSTEEAVVNRALTVDRGGKSLEDYSTLIKAAMYEIARVLKPGAWATVVFHNTDADVWKAIRDAAADAGFSFHEAASLDRRQQSHKGYKGRSGSEDVAHFDVVFNLQKPSTDRRQEEPTRNRTDIRMIVRSVARDRAIVSGGVQAIHAEVMRRLASVGSAKFVDYAEVRAVYESLTTERPTDVGSGTLMRRKR
jgi:tRNA G10  N-methylase Trm11/transcriptional regulator with XRE-family HTH domain/DNA-directed RNA polymerase subunit RPC12/RpoP